MGFAFGIDQFATPEHLPPPIKTFIESVRESRHLLCHPVLLPCIFLANHVQKVRSYVFGFLSDWVVRLESSIGVTRAGQSQRTLFLGKGLQAPEDEPKLFVNGHMQREYARQLVGSINDISTWIIFAKRSPQWDIDSVDFLLGLLGGSTRLHRYREVEGAVFRETLDYLRNYSEACLEITQTSEARMQLQLNIVTYLSSDVLEMIMLTHFFSPGSCILRSLRMMARQALDWPSRRARTARA